MKTIVSIYVEGSYEGNHCLYHTEKTGDGYIPCEKIIQTDIGGGLWFKVDDDTYINGRFVSEIVVKP